jgi:hypothetical protein
MNNTLSKERLSVKKLPWWSIGLGVFLLLAGCDSGKESLHDLDHVQPAHWPSDLQDAAEKIQQRLNLLDADIQPESLEELRDLIEWTPEVAADSDLPELDWQPIYELSETIRRHLVSNDLSLEDCREDIVRLVDLLRESQALLPNSNSASKAQQ